MGALVKVCVIADEEHSANLDALANLIDLINEPTTSGHNTPLHFVALGKNIQLAKWLLDNGAIFVQNENGESPLHWAVKSSENTAIIELFLSHMSKGEIEKLDENEESCMDWAIEYNNKKAIRLLRNTKIFPEDRPSKLVKC